MLIHWINVKSSRSHIQYDECFYFCIILATLFKIKQYFAPYFCCNVAEDLLEVMLCIGLKIEVASINMIQLMIWYIYIQSHFITEIHF